MPGPARPGHDCPAEFHQTDSMYCPHVGSGTKSVPPPFVRMVAHPLRWRMLGELAQSDRRVRELEQKVGELEGVIGRKALESDFFAGALRRIKEARQKRGSSGEMASTRKSGSGCNRKAD